jgi:phospholipase/lecithinase/hemolysin
MYIKQKISLLLNQKTKNFTACLAVGAGLLIGTSASADVDRQLVGFGHNPYEQGNFPSLIGVLDNTYTDENGSNRIGTGPSIMDVISRELFEDGIISQESTAALFSGQGTNYATATATARVKDDPLSMLIGMTTQVNTYLSLTSAEDIENNLYVFAAGQNDVLDAIGTGQFPLLSCEPLKPYKYWRVYSDVRRMDGEYSGYYAGTEYERVAKIMYAAITASKGMLDQLQAAGAKDILIPNVPSPSLYPIVGQIAAGFGCDPEVLEDKANLLTHQFNAAIKRYVKKSDNDDLVIYNIQKDIKTLKKNPSAYGFTDSSNYCYLLDISIPQIFLNPQVQCDDSNENDFLHYVALTLTSNADDFVGRKMAATLLLMSR